MAYACMAGALATGMIPQQYLELGYNCTTLLLVYGRGLHSFTFRLNLSAFCGIGVNVGVDAGVFRRCQGVFRRCQGVLGGIRGC